MTTSTLVLLLMSVVVSCEGWVATSTTKTTISRRPLATPSSVVVRSSSPSSSSSTTTTDGRRSARVVRPRRLLRRVRSYRRVERWRRSRKEVLERRGSSSSSSSSSSSAPSDEFPLQEITSVADLDAFYAEAEAAHGDALDHDKLLRSLVVKGDTQIIGDPARPDSVHNVVRILHERRRRGSRPGARDDGRRVALAVEGGGMRGCVSAGMVVAIDHLGLRECVDVVYGSSAGTIIGSYFLTAQLPHFGPELYYDCLPSAGRDFIDTRRLLRSLGLGLVDPRLLRDVLTRRRNGGKPVLSLTYLLKDTVERNKPLDWEKFKKLQSTQPLKVVVSGLRSEKAIVLDMNDHKSFDTLSQYTDTMYASCLLPGIAGPLMTMRERGNGQTPSYTLGNDPTGRDSADNAEPLADALVYEPLPYRSALAEGATHVVVLRTRPDGVDVTGKGGALERLIFGRFFLRKNRLPRIYDRLRRQAHKRLYGEDVLRLNAEAADLRNGRLLPVALPPGSDEVSRLETGRAAIFEGVRRGFARAYDALVEDPAERGRGAVVAREVFPDDVLDYDPIALVGKTRPGESAYDCHRRLTRDRREKQ